MKFITTTPEGREGFNISYGDEKKVFAKLEKVLPEDWTVSFSWVQIMFSDVAYEVDHEKKTVYVACNQNLMHWSDSIVSEVAAAVTAKVE